MPVDKYMSKQSKNAHILLDGENNKITFEQGPEVLRH
jgi:hypothetical protein